jgi:hypothetical protein
MSAAELALAIAAGVVGGAVALVVLFFVGGGVVALVGAAIEKAGWHLRRRARVKAREREAIERRAQLEAVAARRR